jgi:hypothetical protein
VDNFVDKPCEDELSPRQALSSIGHMARGLPRFFFNFIDLNKKIKLGEPSYACKPHEFERYTTL